MHPRALLCAVTLCALTSPALAQDAPAPAEAALFQGTAEDFRKQAPAQQPIDPAKLNEPLLSAAIFHETNVRRAEQKLPPVGFQPQARAAALEHARAMAMHQTVSHGTPWSATSSTPLERLKAQGLQPRFSAENVALTFLLRYESGKPYYTRQENGRAVFSYEPEGAPLAPHTYLSFAQDILTQWMNSPGHRRNIVAPEAEFLGVGSALAKDANGFDTIYAGQNFFAPLLPPAVVQP